VSSCGGAGTTARVGRSFSTAPRARTSVIIVVVLIGVAVGRCSTRW